MKTFPDYVREHETGQTGFCLDCANMVPGSFCQALGIPVCRGGARDDYCTTHFAAKASANA